MCVVTQRHKSSADYFLRIHKENFWRDVEDLPPCHTHTNTQFRVVVINFESNCVVNSSVPFG